MIEHAWYTNTIHRVQNQHLSNQILDLDRYRVDREVELPLENQLVQVGDIVCFEWYRALNHSI